MEAYCAMTWRPWSTPASLTRMMRANVRLTHLHRDVRAIDAASPVLPAVIVTHVRFGLPPALALLLWALARAVDVDLTYRLAELHVYVPPWCSTAHFPLRFARSVRVRFKALTSKNLDDVLYASTRIPLISHGSPLGCDGGFMFYYLNGSPRTRSNRVTVLSNTSQPTRSLLDDRPISKNKNVTVRLSPCSNSILDWFNPWYALFPAERRKQWLTGSHA